MTNSNGWTGGDGRKIKVLTDDQVQRFFAAIEAQKDPLFRARDNCLFHLMLSLGLRCLEAKLLQVKDVDLKASPATIWVTRVKEKHVRKDPKTGEYVRVEKARRGDRYELSEVNAERVRAWLRARKELDPDAKSDALFLTRQSPTISVNQINYITHQYGRAAGIEYIYPHMFRHSCASRAARKGLSAFEIKERLGHVSVLSSEVYVHLFGPEKAKAIIIIETRGHYEQAKEAL